jgi:hypothetical protein
MKKNQDISDFDIAQMFEEDCARNSPSKQLHDPGAFTFIDNDSYTDEEDEAFVAIFTRVSRGANIRSNVPRGFLSRVKDEE